MEPTLIGYFPKCIATRPDWLQAATVKEVCSVSECISPGPENWIDRWLHNELFVFDDEETAWAVVPGGEANTRFRLLAYRIFPVEFEAGEERPFSVPSLTPQPLPARYRRLGYDVVSRSCGASFECSPLSCNNAAESVKVNEYCLLDNAEEALGLGSICSKTEEGYEPGPYYVLEVWRQKTSSADEG